MKQYSYATSGRREFCKSFREYFAVLLAAIEVRYNPPRTSLRAFWV